MSHQIVALCDHPSPRSMAVTPFIVEGDDIRLALGYATGPQVISPKLYQDSLRRKDILAVPSVSIDPAVIPGVPAALWIGRKFQENASELGVRLPPGPPHRQEVMGDGLFWVAPIQRLREALGRVLQQALHQIATSDDSKRNDQLSRLMGWVDPNSDLTRAGRWLSATNPVARQGCLDWYRRLDRDQRVPEPECGLEEHLTRVGLHASLGEPFEFVRADGDCLCPDCGQPYWKHALATQEELGPLATLHELCDGSMVKL